MTEFDKNDFYQSKYNYYGLYAMWVVVLGALSSISYFVSDCQLFGRFSRETFIQRFIILIPMAIYLYLYFWPKITNYKIMVICGYIVMHLIMWNTIFSAYCLTDRSHVDAGVNIIHLLFLAYAFCAPAYMAGIAHSIWVVNILVSNVFMHYEDFSVIISLGVPCVVAISALHVYMERVYRTHYDATKKLEYYSFYDSLTDTYNRNILGKIVDEDSQSFKSELGDKVGIIMFDVDFFKKVNDTYGHLKGDIILKTIVKTAKKHISENDYFIRWGGEEFVVFCPGKGKAEVGELAETIRRDVENTENGVCKVTVSMGVAEYNTGDDYKHKINKADLALYEAKKNGRNRVEKS